MSPMDSGFSIPLGNLPPSFQQEYASISRERDPELRAEQLLQMGSRLEAGEELEAALGVFTSLLIPHPGSSSSIRNRAQERLNAITGVGAVGPRAEFLLRRLTRGATDPAMLLGMGVASSAFRLTRLATLARGMGPLRANLLAFGLEAGSFPVVTRLAATAMGRPMEWNSDLVGREIASCFILLGGMRLAGRAVRFPSPLAGEGARRAGEGVLRQQGAMLGGILLGHRLETAVGLRPHTDGATTLTDSLVLLLQFHVAGRLTHQVLGEGFARWEQGMDAQFDLLRRASSRAPLPLPIFSQLHASPVGAGSVGSIPELSLARPGILMMSQGPQGGEGGRPNPSRRAPRETVEQGNVPPKNQDAWFSPEDIEPFRLSVDYSPQARAWIKELMPRLPKRMPRDLTRENVLSFRPDERLIDQVWLYQLLDLGSKVGASVDLYGPERLLEPMHPEASRGDSAILETALSLLAREGRDPKKQWVLEMSIPHPDIRFGARQEGDVYLSVEHMVRQIQGSLGNRLPMIHSEEGRLTIRLPGLGLMERLFLAYSGSRAPRFVFVRGGIPQDEVVFLRERRLTPVGIVPVPTAAEEFGGRTPPVLFTLHELLHSGGASELPEEAQLLGAYLYRLAKRRLRGEAIRQDHLNHLSDLDIGSGFDGRPETFYQFTLNPFWRRLGKDLVREDFTLPDLNPYLRFFGRYQRALEEQPPADPSLLAAYREFQGVLRVNQAKLREFLIELVRKTG